MAEKILVEFIKQSRKMGFTDAQIRKEIDSKGWPTIECEKAFLSFHQKPKLNNHVTLYLNDDIIKALLKRADKNLFTLSEQIEDILRRSCMNKKSIPKEEKIDDRLLLAFSRQKARKKK